MHRVATPLPVLTTDHPERQCVDLRSTFGTRYRYDRDPAYQAETPAARKVERAWLTIIQCKYGKVFPWAGRRGGTGDRNAGRRDLEPPVDASRGADGEGVDDDLG